MKTIGKLGVSINFKYFITVDFNHIIHMVKLEDYQATVCKETWDIFQQMCDTFKERKLRVSFFNSTPQGGGGEKIKICYCLCSNY